MRSTSKNKKLINLKLRFFSKLIIFTFLTLVLSSCPDQKCENGQKGTIKDYTGLDGCSWIIELDNGKRIEPSNQDFIEKFEPEDGMKVIVSFKPDSNGISICMVGEMVIIKCIEKE